MLANLVNTAATIASQAGRDEIHHCDLDAVSRGLRLL